MNAKLRDFTYVFLICAIIAGFGSMLYYTGFDSGSKEQRVVGRTFLQTQLKKEMAKAVNEQAMERYGEDFNVMDFGEFVIAYPVEKVRGQKIFHKIHGNDI